MNYGIELEFFVLNQKNELIPAYDATSNVDGNPIIGEIKTGVHDNIIDCVFELKKLIYLEKEKLAKKFYKMDFSTSQHLSENFIKEVRKSDKSIEMKQLEKLEEFSIYPKGKTGKILSKNTLKASLQVNISENSIFYYTNCTKMSGKSFTTNEKKHISNVFNYIEVISKLDQAFRKELYASNRVKGVYAIKDGQRGNRIEYRSLPNNICLDKLINILK